MYTFLLATYVDFTPWHTHALSPLYPLKDLPTLSSTFPIRRPKSSRLVSKASNLSPILAWRSYISPASPATVSATPLTVSTRPLTVAASPSVILWSSWNDAGSCCSAGALALAASLMFIEPSELDMSDTVCDSLWEALLDSRFFFSFSNSASSEPS